MPVEPGFWPAPINRESHISRLAVTSVGNRVAVVNNANTLAVWRIGARKASYQVQHAGLIVKAAFSPGGTLLATAGGDTARLWDAASGAPLARLEHDDAVVDLTFSPDGNILATASKDNTVRLWDTKDGTQRLRLTHNGPLRAIRYGNNGQILAAGTTVGAVRLWDAASGKPLMSASLGVDLQYLAISPNGQHIAAAGFDPAVKVWDAKSGEQLAALQHVGNVSAMLYTPDGRLVVGTWNGRIQVWSADDMRMQAKLRSEDTVNAIALSADGHFLVAGSADRTARVFRMVDMREITRLTHPVAVSAVAFSPDGQNLITASGDLLTPPHRLWFWPWRLDALVKEACKRVPRNFTLEEWRQHLPGEPYRRTCPLLPQHPSVLISLLDRARAASGRGRAAEAEKLFAQLVEDGRDSDDLSVVNLVCWFGSLNGQARRVLPLCERAVNLAPDDGSVKDSRGLARALAGDRTGAIEDFTAFIAWAKRNMPQSPIGAKREQWIAALRKGGNPFDSETLATLQEER